MAWNLSTETAWHRCATDPTVALTSPPEGRYTLEAQDETQLCSESDTSAPGRNVTWRRSTLVVDGTPPAIAPPVVNAPAAVVASSRPIVHIDAAITDTLSGVATTVWNAGDGSPPAPVLGRRVGGFRHQYGIGRPSAPSRRRTTPAIRRPAVKRSLLTRRPNSVRILLRAPVRRAIARTLRRHRPVRAQVSLVAVDGAGNRRAAAAAARITG